MDRTHKVGGGIAFLIKDNILYNLLNINIKLEALEIGAITIRCKLEEIIIVAGYRAPSTRNRLREIEWNKLINEISKYRFSILCGDFNAHHPSWGSTHECPNGRTIFENTSPDELILINDGSPIHIKINKEKIIMTNIDITFVSPELGMLSSWQVSEDKWGSDHFPTILKIDLALFFT